MFIRDLEHLVGIESGSYQPEGVEAVAAWMMERLERLGASVERFADAVGTATHVATFDGPADGPTVLVLGHADTVFQPGTSAARPLRTDGGRAFGPGVLDMKAGLLVALYAVTALRETATEGGPWLPVGRLVFIVNPDEEIGSPSSSAIIRSFAAEADAALVLEAARANGDIVSARAGMTHLRMDIKGRPAHAGVEPERGASAVLAAAHQVVALHALNDHARGRSVNAGVVSGGTRPNIVPDAASITVDVRARRRADQEAMLSAIEAIARSIGVPGTSTALVRLANHWPMEPTPASRHLASLALRLAREHGWSMGQTDTGGASDANTTAALGVPSLDGLGPVGGGAHTPEEYLVLESVAPRTRLLAELIGAIGRDRAFRRSAESD